MNARPQMTTLAVRSALLRSTDSGKTWSDTGVWMTGCITTGFYVLDAKHAWAMVSWGVEGPTPPIYTFRTADGGKTWTRSKTPLPGKEKVGVIPFVKKLSFRDARNGEAIMGSAAGDFVTFTTDNGGDTWKATKRYRLDAYDEPRRYSVSPLRDESDYKKGLIHIQRTADGGKTWITLGTIPRKYPTDDNDVQFNDPK